MGAVHVPAPCEGGAPHASLSPVGGCSPGTLGTPTLSLYLLEADFRVPAVPGGPRPCFRSCMETSWLAVRDRAAPWNTEGPSRRPASSPPGGTLASSALGGPSGSCSPSRCPRRGCEASGPGPQWPQARTCLLDGDGEAVVVGAALGLHRHVAGRVTCRTGARQVRGRGGHTPPGTQRWPRAAGAPGSTGAGSRDTAGVAGATTSPQRACSAGALRGGSPRAWGRDTSWSHESLWNTRMNAWPRVSNEVAAEPGLGLGPRSRVIWPSPGKGPLPSPYGHALVTKDGATNVERKLRF